MKIFSALIFHEEGNGLFQADALCHEGKYWLVPNWVGTPASPKTNPVRLILIDSLPHNLQFGSPFGDIVVNVPIPIAVYEGRVRPSPESGFVVIENPDIPVSSQMSH